MRKKGVLPALLLTLLVTVGCTHNNGGNGQLWGTWKLEAITVDGVEVDDYEGTCFWKFQGDVILIQEVDRAMHESVDHYGTWSLSDNNDVLTLFFNHSDDNYQSSTGPYSPPENIFLTQAVSHLLILTDIGTSMALTTVSNGRSITYVLNKR